jgi:hypothetical protein
MNRIIKFAALIILLLIIPVSTAISFEGPLQVKNQYPIFLHADQQYLEKAAMENSMSYSLSHSSTYTVQQSGEWTINLDMEITEINFRYRRIVKDLFEFNLDLPIIVLGGGFMDGFLEDYHDTFGFSDYGRSERPHNDFLYEVKRNGNTIIDGKSGINIGDIRLAVKKPLLSSDNFTLSLRGDVEIPVSSAKKGYSNGSFDAGVSVLLDKRITDRIMTHFNLGYVFPGDVRGYERLDIKNFIHGGAAIDAVLSENWNIIIQLQGQSAIYPETDLRAVDRDEYLIAFGGRYQTETGTLEFSLTEDLNTSGAPDFIINLTYKHYI